MTSENFEKLCVSFVELVKISSPINTGNLRHNAIRYEFIDKDTFKIYVDESIAPYMPFTNEIWLSEKWINKKTGIKAVNPNEGWWQNKAVGSVILGIMRELDVETVKKND